MCRSRGLLGSSCVGALLALAATGVQAGGEVHVPGAFGGFQVGVSSMQARRFQGVIRQQHDFSCGSAVVATLLTHHYGIEMTEAEAFRRMYAAGDQERIRRLGFSMLDMKELLSGLGLRADGYRLSLPLLEEVGVPAIALVETRGYRHFVLIKAIRGERVLVGDPALGLTAYSRRAFEALRSNDILFLLRDSAEAGRTSFSQAPDWRALAEAPVEAGLLRAAVADFTLALPRRSEW